MSAPEERLARVALSRLGEPGEVRLARLVRDLGAIRVLDHLLGKHGYAGVKEDVAARLEHLDPAAELVRAERMGVRFVIPGDAEWPTRIEDLHHVPALQERGGVPLGLWVKGPVRLDEIGRAVSVVGSRSATSYGEGVAGDIGADLAKRPDMTVISGAAFGIDQAAHRGALAMRGRTVAVLACGADRIYPAAHKRLLDHLAEHGAVISETPPGCAPTRIRFLARNRIIAALAEGTVVVEAAARSGALNTANWTDRLHRRLMGVPGPVTAAQSEGVHQLIRTGAATLVTRGADVLELVGAPGEDLAAEPRGRARSRDSLTVRQQQVIDAVPVRRGAAADSIAGSAGVGLLEVQRTLETLWKRDLVAREGDGWRLGTAAMD